MQNASLSPRLGTLIYMMCLGIKEDISQFLEDIALGFYVLQVGHIFTESIWQEELIDNNCYLIERKKASFNDEM